MWNRFHVKHSCHILMKLEFSRQILEQSVNIKVHPNPSQWESSCFMRTDGRTDGRTWSNSRISRTRLKTAFTHFASHIVLGSLTREWSSCHMTFCVGPDSTRLKLADSVELSHRDDRMHMNWASVRPSSDCSVSISLVLLMSLTKQMMTAVKLQAVSGRYGPSMDVCVVDSTSYCMVCTGGRGGPTFSHARRDCVDV
jgi:hypothetical protein